MKHVLAVVGALALAGCSGGLAVPGSGVPSSDTTFARAARVAEPMVTCAEATQSAVDAVRRLGYTVTDVKRATAEEPGLVLGVRELGFTAANPVAGGQNTIKVRVTCSDAGSSFEAVSDEGGLAQLNFPSRFSSILKKEVSTKRQRQTRPAEPARGLVLTMEPQRSAEAMAEFGVDLPAAGVTPVKLEINNRSDRSYAFDSSQVTLVTTQGRREKSMSIDAVVAKLAGEQVARLRARVIADGEIAPGALRGGYLFFPASTYRRARVVLMDIESDEPEGFSIAF
jgi:hypothetical protein